ncbi:spore coat protein GerQ [Microaerobacter geothermalis]|uniref:spore coat protein GerQ n=1 Tax=Microaerobacter geothermalis TaxID=674972 RepID=UPI001F1EB1F3|nr:spore coat protein GerQ [Microaerobacter geothermalis]MCF6094001.1 spore coat protein GerQ [Microaerobacter geothermalis]
MNQSPFSKVNRQFPYYGYPYPFPYPGYPFTGQVPVQVPPPIPPSGAVIPTPPVAPTIPGQLPMEESYIENILRLNLGKMATIYMTFENNSQWNAKVFKGVLEAAGRDHIIISDPKTGTRYLLLMVNLDYITFDEELNYFYPPAGAPQPRRKSKKEY